MTGGPIEDNGLSDEKTVVMTQLAKERNNMYCREVRDYMRTGDTVLLKRILFRNLVLAPVHANLKLDKARALMMLIESDNSMTMNIY